MTVNWPEENQKQVNVWRLKVVLKLREVWPIKYIKKRSDIVVKKIGNHFELNLVAEIMI